MNQQDIHKELTHTTDGPVTRYVLIFRACQLAAAHPQLVQQIADELHEVLQVDDAIMAESSEGC